MGQKINPTGYRLAVSKDWRSRWYAPEATFAENLHQDLAIRRFIDKRLRSAAISRVTIERAWNQVRVTLHTARPGLVIGRKGAEIESAQIELTKMCGDAPVKIDIIEIKQPETDAQLVAESVAVQLERRIAFRRAMKRAVQIAMDFGAKGIKIRCGGRLGGADIARAEAFREGKVPLQTLRVPIDYGFYEARTTYGIIGVKCWINRGEDDDTPEEGGDKPSSKKAANSRASGPRPPRQSGPRPARDAAAKDDAKAEKAPADPAPAKKTSAPAEEAPAADDAASKSVPSGASIDDKKGLVYDKAPDVVDDLKEISGVGPVLEGKLHDQGIYTFDQVANWKKGQIAEFSDLLSFPDRIERDDWVSQAKKLNQDKK